MPVGLPGNRRIEIGFDRAVVAGQQTEQRLLGLCAIERFDRAGNRLRIGDDLLLGRLLRRRRQPASPATTTLRTQKT